MRVTYLDIHEGDTILSIAKRAGLSVPSIIRRHNWLALPNNKIVDFSIPSHLTSLQLTDILPPLTQEEEELFYFILKTLLPRISLLKQLQSIVVNSWL